MGLGGAFTSLADDPSGLYYNPAGIADVRETSLQVATSLYGFERGSIQNDLTLPVPGVENLDVSFTDLVIVPASAGFVKTFGDKGNDGENKQAYGVSVIVPSFRSFSSQSQNLETVSNGFATLYQRRVMDRFLWSGMGYGHKIGYNLCLGISVYYVLRSLVDSEDVSANANLQNNTSGQQMFRTAANDISLINGNAIVIIGAKYKITSRLNVGITLQMASIRLHGNGTLRSTRSEAMPECLSNATCTLDNYSGSNLQSRFTSQNLEKITSETKQPWTLRTGVSYSPKYRYTVSADVSIHFPVSYRLLDVPGTLDEQLPFNSRIKRNLVVNFNVGAEYLMIREVSVAAGYFTDYSSADRIGETLTTDMQPHVNLSGLTMALGYFGKHSLSRLGVVYSFGNGYDVIPTSGDDERLLSGSQGYTRVNYFQSFFYMFLSSTFRY